MPCADMASGVANLVFADEGAASAVTEERRSAPAATSAMAVARKTGSFKGSYSLVGVTVWRINALHECKIIARGEE